MPKFTMNIRYKIYMPDLNNNDYKMLPIKSPTIFMMDKFQLQYYFCLLLFIRKLNIGPKIH